MWQSYKKYNMPTCSPNIQLGINEHYIIATVIANVRKASIYDMSYQGEHPLSKVWNTEFVLVKQPHQKSLQLNTCSEVIVEL